MAEIEPGARSPYLYSLPMLLDLVEGKRIDAVAKRYCYPTASVKKAIKKLDDWLGVRLFIDDAFLMPTKASGAFAVIVRDVLQLLGEEFVTRLCEIRSLGDIRLPAFRVFVATEAKMTHNEIVERYGGSQSKISNLRAEFDVWFDQYRMKVSNVSEQKFLLLAQDIADLLFHGRQAVKIVSVNDTPVERGSPPANDLIASIHHAMLNRTRDTSYRNKDSDEKFELAFSLLASLGQPEEGEGITLNKLVLRLRHVSQ